MEGQAEHLDVEVNGVAGEVAFWPAPIAVFDDQAGIGRQNKIACVPRNEFKSALLEQRDQRGNAGGADLFAGPALTFKQWVGHSLYASGVG